MLIAPRSFTFFDLYFVCYNDFLLIITVPPIPAADRSVSKNGIHKFVESPVLADFAEEPPLLESVAATAGMSCFSSKPQTSH